MLCLTPFSRKWAKIVWKITAASIKDWLKTINDASANITYTSPPNGGPSALLTDAHSFVAAWFSTWSLVLFSFTALKHCRLTCCVFTFLVPSGFELCDIKLQFYQIEQDVAEGFFSDPATRLPRVVETDRRAVCVYNSVGSDRSESASVRACVSSVNVTCRVESNTWSSGCDVRKRQLWNCSAAFNYIRRMSEAMTACSADLCLTSGPAFPSARHLLSLQFVTLLKRWEEMIMMLLYSQVIFFDYFLIWLQSFIHKNMPFLLFTLEKKCVSLFVKKSERFGKFCWM